MRSLGRFVINSTIGIGGLFDVATKLHLPGYAPTGFGTTLVQMGHASRSLPGHSLSWAIDLAGRHRSLGDYGDVYGINIADLYRGSVAGASGLPIAIDQRANVDFRYYSTGSPFEYDYIRFLYVRKLLLEDAGLHRKDPPKKRDAGVPAGQ